HHRDGNRERELTEELAGDAPQYAAGQQHRTEHERDRENWPGDFLHGAEGGFADAQSFFQPALDVFQNDDRVIDDDADRQHQAKQRQIVQREAKEQHHGERADQRHADVDYRQQQRLPILQEEQNNERHDDHRFTKRMKHFAHRFANERRSVIYDAILEP